MSTTSAPSAHRKILVCFHQSGDTVSYRVKKDTNILKLINTYCDDNQVRFRSFEFLYEGKRLPRSKTFAQVGFKDGDQIDVLRYVSGGGASK